MAACTLACSTAYRLSVTAVDEEEEAVLSAAVKECKRL